jgi:starch-binding outer membrane protein, SusD/RagB family
MKNLLTFILTIMAIAMTSCEGELDQKPISSATTVNFYRNPADFEVAVNGIYNALRGYPDRAFYLSENRSDNLYGVGSAGVRDWEPINNFHLTIASNPLVSEAWNANYLGIFRANTLLEFLSADKVPDEVTRNRFEGEARFLRAFFYFDLIRYFGRVPLIESVVSPAQVLIIKRAPVSSVYDLIISDLESAINLLPVSYPPTGNGRITSHAARGILALVYMTRSGPTYDIEGPGMDSDEYSKALVLINEIIASAKYSFLPSYASIFAYNNEYNAEVVFDIGYQKGQLGIGGTYPGNHAPAEYFAVKGLPFAIGLEILPVSNDLLARYSETDVRKAFNFQLGFTNVKGVVETRAFERKWIEDAGYGLDRFDWPINYIVLRYTDVLMMKAECILNGAPGTQTEVDDIVNDVRVRAGDEEIADVTLDILLDERRKEFAGESSRWHDLVRSGKVITIMKDFIETEDVKGQMSEPTENMILYPVPQNQMDVKKGLYEQNPGYN